MDKKLENTFLTALEQNQQKLLRICSVYAKDPEDTKDLFQEVLIHLWQSMASFEAKSSIGTWMFRITLNVCLRFRSNHIKQQERFITMDDTFMANVRAQAESNEQNELLEKLRNCIKQLNEAHKAIMSLYLEEIPYKEISAITSLTENNIAVKVKRIKRKLLNCINEIL